MTTDAAVREKSILAIIGSPRRLGNCELFAKEIWRHAPDGVLLDLVRLPELNIMPCVGCYQCIGPNGRCGIGDDADFLVEQVRTHDALIIASPVYFLGTHGSFKRLLDRSFSFFHVVEAMGRKPCVLVNTYGLKERLGTAPQALLTFASFLGLEVKASVSLQAALPGDVFASEAYRETAARLGRLLFEPKRADALFAGEAPGDVGRVCPFCGNDIVRMRDKDFICTLCHGTFTLDDEGRTVRGEEGWRVQDIRFVRDHRTWLSGMKDRFLANRKEIARLTLPYKEDGRWLKP